MAEKDIEKILRDYKKETKRHFDVVAEDLKGEIKIVAGNVSQNTQKIDTLQKDVNTIKEDIEVIKN